MWVCGSEGVNVRRAQGAGAGRRCRMLQGRRMSALRGCNVSGLKSTAWRSAHLEQRVSVQRVDGHAIELRVAEHAHVEIPAAAGGRRPRAEALINNPGARQLRAPKILSHFRLQSGQARAGSQALGSTLCSRVAQPGGGVADVLHRAQHDFGVHVVGDGAHKLEG